ncbi:MAG TPA: metallophosphoesterase [Usitatibacter sp.]|nr:metallophosphoesterase [Usitatibacter sp.]
MTARAAAALAALAATLAGCSLAPPAPGGFRFAVMGDTPYNAGEERAFVAMLARIDAAPVEFAIHVGDFKAGGNSPCTDAVYFERKTEFDRSVHPIVLTPGDNDWTDCRRRSNGAMDPIERLARLREIFFATPASLGRAPMATRMQSRCMAPAIPGCGCDPHPENRMWVHGRVTFVTLNVPGSNDNRGHGAASEREADCRDEANRQWLEEAVDGTERTSGLGLVIALQADPWATEKPVYKGLLAQVADAGRRLARPVLFVHGDSHTYRVDAPFRDASGTPIEDITRLEVYGSPFVGWVEVTVDPAYPGLFRIDPHLEALVP